VSPVHRYRRLITMRDCKVSHPLSLLKSAKEELQCQLLLHPLSMEKGA
jgi:hypothetical protein